MPISVQSLVDRAASELDAEGSDYFKFDLDYLPAICSGVDELVSVISKFMSENRASDEALRELTYTRVFQTSAYSRVQLNETLLGNQVWGITAILPLPETVPTFTQSASPNLYSSAYRPDLAHISSGSRTAKRCTTEEWETNYDNPFDDSHALESGETARFYGYLPYQNYTGTNYSFPSTIVPVSEIEIRPTINRGGVTIRYIAAPTYPTLITDNIAFPQQVFNLLLSLMMKYLSVKIGDGTTLYTINQSDFNILASSLT